MPSRLSLTGISFGLDCPFKYADCFPLAGIMNVSMAMSRSKKIDFLSGRSELTLNGRITLKRILHFVVRSDGGQLRLAVRG